MLLVLFKDLIFFNSYFYQCQVLLLLQFSSTFFSIRSSQNTVHCMLHNIFETTSLSKKLLTL